MVQAPTGAGKTVLAASMVTGALAKGNRVLFVVPFLSLIEQTVAAFKAQGIDAVGVMQGYHWMTDGSQPVQVASIQTLQRRMLPMSDLVIVDEAHRWFAFMGEWMARPEWQKVPFIGLSATPWTKGLGKHYDDLIVAATTSELIELGFLSPFRVFAPAHPDLSGVKVVAGDYHEGQLSETMQQPVLVADTVSTWLRLGEDRPTLVLRRRPCSCQEADRPVRGGRCADRLCRREYAHRRAREDRRRLREGQIKVIVNIATMTTGVDLDVRCIILARPTKSEILYTQIVGRGLRTAEGKQDCLILDHSDTTLRLGFVTDIHHEHLDDGRHKKSKASARDKSPPLPKECPSCHYLKPAGVHRCPECGFVPERRSAIEEKAGSLVQLNGKRRAATAQPAAVLFDVAVDPARARLQTGLCRGEVQRPLRPLAAWSG